jgi:AraC-like DNA-binding protein/quercetin dioxygenase-like cupin family protein
MKRMPVIGSAWEIGGNGAARKARFGTYRGDIPDQSFRFNIVFVEHSAPFPMHSHEYSELVIVLGGRGLHLTDSESYPIEEGDTFVIPGHRRHGFGETQKLRLCNIMFDPRQFLAPHRDLRRMMGYHALFDLEPRTTPPDHSQPRLHLSAEEMIYVTNLLSTLKAEFDGRIDGRRTIIRSTFLLLVAYLSRAYERQKRDAGTPLVRMANVIAHIQKHFREALRVEDLARLAHWSCSQFQRAFKRTYRTTPLQFIQQVRIHEACELLKNPNLDITSVALQSGFPSSSVFSTRFKQFMGESPSQYRRKKRIEAEAASMSVTMQRPLAMSPSLHALRLDASPVLLSRGTHARNARSASTAAMNR